MSALPLAASLLPTKRQKNSTFSNKPRARTEMIIETCEENGGGGTRTGGNYMMRIKRGKP
jgi:hypothetical protein